MAKRNKLDNLRPFQKGQSGNPKGRPPDALNAAMKKLTKVELEEMAALIIKGNREELERVGKDKTSSILKLWIASVALNSIKKGDMYSLDVLLNRLVGKVKEHTHFSGDVSRPLVVNFNGIKKDKRKNG